MERAFLLRRPILINHEMEMGNGIVAWDIF